ncbi:glucose-6-phosphate isomerase [Clostridium sp. MCC353]|uniref:glucose-6-phosphate isomerase n=1 Tax=Clostridium sp. MCC353 TaxID=2592646 RepID=UPI001C025A03|nr:glucose-6-phosphate isomerase [Clostridium sp. MCC353]MBT9777337.1 glucose-6-phosphate isomerase [Clostridium sp. MCC353]
MEVQLNLDYAASCLNPSELEEQQKAAVNICKSIFEKEDKDRVLGWRTLEESAVMLDIMEQKAKKVRMDADIFVIVGVGGSNQAARAVIEAFPDRKGPEIVYLGNTLSPHYISQMLKKLEGKSVYINVIAKNFETLGPGSHFRILRQWMRERYTKEEMAERIILTGTAGSRLDEIAKENGYLFLPFPEAVGGRYSAFTPVALFPLLVSGLDVDAYLRGAEDAVTLCRERPEESPSVRYAAARSLLYKKGYDIEMLVSFEPQFYYFEKWWWQLFGESEGKDKKGIYPSMAVYSEDLHSIGQYVQDGRRNLIETFLSAEDPKASAVILPDPEFGDRFDYLDNMDFDTINKIAEKATMEAHADGGVPCVGMKVKEISEETFGGLFYTFMMACACSGILTGVNPFDQEGVEAYKRSMFQALGKPQK